MRYRAPAGLLAAGLLAAGAPVAAAQPAHAPVVINEIGQAEDGAWVELANQDEREPADVSGWLLVDPRSDVTVTLPPNTVIEPGGYHVIEPGGRLGKDGELVLRSGADDVDAASWQEPAEQSWGRVPDKVGDFDDTRLPTPGESNVPRLGDGQKSGSQKTPWHDAKVDPFDVGGPFSEPGIVSLAATSDGDVVALNGEGGTVHGLEYLVDLNSYEPTWSAQLQTLKPGLDARAIDVAGERLFAVAQQPTDDEERGPRREILTFDLPEEPQPEDADELVDLQATQSWGIATLAREAGVSLDSEVSAIAALEDNRVAVGFTGYHKILVFDLSTASPSLVDTVETALPGVAELEHDPETGELWALCGEECAGAVQRLERDEEGSFRPAPGATFQRPANLPDVPVAGFARVSAERPCPGGEGAQRVDRLLWANPTAAEGVSLYGALNKQPCGADGGAQPEAGVPDASPAPGSGEAQPAPRETAGLPAPSGEPQQPRGALDEAAGAGDSGATAAPGEYSRKSSLASTGVSGVLSATAIGLVAIALGGIALLAGARRS
ncbi:lamin tail domain-containing protein [Corynebacterium otitidis]|uniref:Putative secreted protein n=3 Tax=Corynebacterium otitidis ATCC 51513 TaxID=883169 RepID=I7IXK7_9CORY|nr:lamin tail domain-containing protein [Corynebacterium otitidis]CCI83883.1 putative secreted protein [Corynebacterium otitidis ATCC 51513]